MDSTILVALIGVLGIIIVAILSPIIDKILAGERKNKNSPFNGKWKGIWFIQENDIESIYAEDEIDILESHNLSIRGKGYDPRLGKDGSYIFSGRSSINGVLTLTHQIDNITKNLSGVVIFKINPLGDTLDGYWKGYLIDGTINGGKVTWKKIS